jgi:hypothetical protein
MDPVICPRGEWIIEVSELFAICMLNGQNFDSAGAFTCKRHNGNSTPDYMFARGAFSSF